MRKLQIVLLALLMCVLSVPAQAVTIEMLLGAGYMPGTYQDATQLKSAISYGAKFAMFTSPHLMAEIHAQMYSAGLEASEEVSRMYTGQLGGKYYSKPMYAKDATTGISTPIYTMINPYVRVGAGVADGKIVTEDINTFLSYATGFGIRWDPTRKSQDVALEAEAMMVTGTGSEGQSQTQIGVNVNAAFQFQFLSGGQ